MKLRLTLLITAMSLSACASGSFDIQQDELSHARAAIATAKAAHAERCAPKLLAEAEASLYWAAHELDETSMHPDETAELIAKAESKGKQAKRLAMRNCSAKPYPTAPEIISLSGVQFETNSAELTGNSITILNRAINTLHKRATIHVEVAAHTDSLGKASYNMALSERRAKSVHQYLIDHGIDTTRLSAKGYGETQPVASNKTASGRAKNRRVELRVLN